MHIDASKLGIALDIFLLIFELEMVAFSILVLLASSKIDHEYLVLFLAQTNQKIIGLDIIIDQSLRMHPFHSLQYLVSYQEDGFECERTLAVSQQLL